MTWGFMGEYVHRQIFLTFLLLFLNLFKLRIGILLGSRSRLHTRWDLRLCFSRLTLDSSVDIACFLMKGSLIKFAHKAISHKVHGPTRSENARHLLVWVYRERCEHILYAFWASYTQGQCWFCAAKTKPEFHLGRFPWKAWVITGYVLYPELHARYSSSWLEFEILRKFGIRDCLVAMVCCLCESIVD